MRLPRQAQHVVDQDYASQQEQAEKAWESSDGHSHLRNKLREIADARGNLSGIPMPIEGLPLVIEPTFKYRSLAEIGCAKDKETVPEYKIRNTFWSRKVGGYVAAIEYENGQSGLGIMMGSANAVTSLLETLKASDAWGLEQEQRAIRTLGEHISQRKLKQYLLTGSFIETSITSGVVYMFRRLRPTVAMSYRSNGGDLKVLCTLCMHPIGYYRGCFAGCMCPTDDVIAHLMMMRSDEKMFWRRCEQHPAHDPASGIGA